MLSCHLINIKLTTVIQITMSKGRFTIFFWWRDARDSSISFPFVQSDCTTAILVKDVEHCVSPLTNKGWFVSCPFCQVCICQVFPSFEKFWEFGFFAIFQTATSEESFHAILMTFSLCWCGSKIFTNIIRCFGHDFVKCDLTISVDVKIIKHKFMSFDPFWIVKVSLKFDCVFGSHFSSFF